MEPFYTKAEQMYQVHGVRGVDPTEPPASAPYPYPPVSHEPRIQQLFDDLKAAGFHPFPAPCGIMLDEQHMENSQCIRCQTCDGFPCLVHAKSDAEVLGVRPALQYPNVTLLRNSKVLKLHHECRAADPSRKSSWNATAKRRLSPAISSSSRAVPPIPRSCC